MTKDTNTITWQQSTDQRMAGTNVCITGMQNEATEQEQTNGNQIDETLNC